MKKLLGILVMLFWCSVALAQSSLPECDGNDKNISKYSKKYFKKSKKWTNCHGTTILKNGSQYVGEFQGGKYSGQGTFTWEDGEFAGDKYVGEFMKGKRSGLGTYTFADGYIDHGIWRKDKFIERKKAGTSVSKKSTGNNIEFTTSIGKHKNTCKELGFTPGTEAFGNCALKLIELEVVQQGNNKAVQQFQIVRQEPAYDGWMGELGLSILRGDFNKKVQQPAYRFPTQQRSICRFRDGGIGKPYMTCTTR